MLVVVVVQGLFIFAGWGGLAEAPEALTGRDRGILDDASQRGGFTGNNEGDWDGGGIPLGEWGGRHDHDCEPLTVETPGTSRFTTNPGGCSGGGGGGGKVMRQTPSNKQHFGNNKHKNKNKNSKGGKEEKKWETWDRPLPNAKHSFFPSRTRFNRQGLPSVKSTDGKGGTSNFTSTPERSGRGVEESFGGAPQVATGEGIPNPAVQASRSWASSTGGAAAAGSAVQASHSWASSTGGAAAAGSEVHSKKTMIRKTLAAGEDEQVEREKQPTRSRPPNPKSWLHDHHSPPVRDARKKPPATGAGNDVAVHEATQDGGAVGTGGGGAASQPPSSNNMRGRGYGCRKPNDNAETGGGGTTEHLNGNATTTFFSSSSTPGAGAGVAPASTAGSAFSGRSGRSILRKGGWAASGRSPKIMQGRFLTATPNTAAATTTCVVSRTPRAREECPPTGSDYRYFDHDERSGYGEQQQQQKRWASTNNKAEEVASGGGGAASGVGMWAPTPPHSVADPSAAVPAATAFTSGGGGSGGGESTTPMQQGFFPTPRPYHPSAQVVLSPVDSTASGASSMFGAPAPAPANAPAARQEEESMPVVLEEIAASLSKGRARAGAGGGREMRKDVKTTSRTQKFSSAGMSGKPGRINENQPLSSGATAAQASVAGSKKPDNNDNNKQRRDRLASSRTMTDGSDTQSNHSKNLVRPRWVPGVVGTGVFGGGYGGGNGKGQGLEGGRGRRGRNKKVVPEMSPVDIDAVFPAEDEVCEDDYFCIHTNR